MILECGIGILGCYLAYRANNKDSIQSRKDKKIIKQKWQILMDGMGYAAENKIKQEYELLDIIPKHYGWDAKVSIPPSKKYTDIRAIIPSIEIMYKANAMINLAPNKSSAYLRVHNVDKEISIKDELKFKWFKTFYGISEATNGFGETLSIKDIDEIKSPYNEVVGYKIASKIPLGLSYKNIISSQDILSRTLGKCFFDFDAKKLELNCSIIHVPFDDMVKFVPMKVKPWELYVGMRYDWIPVILDYSKNANTIIGGNQGTGKTISLITGFLNLCLNCNNFKMFVASYGEKQDLIMFKYLKQCVGFATTMDYLKGMLRYLLAEMKRRYKIFSSQKEPCHNIYEFNESMKKEEYKLEIWHFLTDEVADLIVDDEVQDMIWSLARKGRASGIYVSVATQRGTVVNLSPETKAMVKNKICFSQSNTSSVQTIMGNSENTNDMVMGLEKSREFVIDYDYGIKIAKTLNLNNRNINDFINTIKDKDHKPLKFNLDGTIKEDKPKEENNEKDSKNDKKPPKSSKNDEKFINLRQK